MCMNLANIVVCQTKVYAAYASLMLEGVQRIHHRHPGSSDFVFNIPECPLAPILIIRWISKDEMIDVN